MASPQLLASRAASTVPETATEAWANVLFVSEMWSSYARSIWSGIAREPSSYWLEALSCRAHVATEKRARLMICLNILI